MAAARSGPQIPPFQVALIGAILLAIGGAVFYFLFYEEKVAALEAKQGEVAAEESRIGVLEQRKANLQKVEDEAKEIEKRIADLKKRLPSSQEELNEFLADINQRQQNARVEQWLLYQPLPPVRDGEIERIPIRMEFLATYEAAASFFWELSRMGSSQKAYASEQIVNVTQFGVVRETSLPPGVVKVSCTVETFLYVGPADDGAAEGGDDGKRKRRRK